MKVERTLMSRTSWRRLPLRPWLALLFAGMASLGLYFLLAPASGPGAYYRSVLHRFTYGYNRQILLLFVPYAIVLAAWWQGRRVPVRVLLAGAVTLHLVVLFAPLPQSQDFYQYLFYGRMQAEYAANPYVVHPSVFYADSWYGMIRWPNQTSVYGPAWSLLSLVVTRAAGDSLVLGVMLMKLAVFAMDLAVIASIIVLAGDREDRDGAAGWGLLVYAWNPLVLISVPLAGLADAGVAAGMLGAMVARRKGRMWVVTVLLCLATLVKVYAAVALLLHLVLLLGRQGRRDALRHAALAAAIAVVTFAPYWAGWQTFRGLLNIADMSNKSLTGTVQKLLVPVFRALQFETALDDAAAVVRWLVAPALAGAVIWAVRRTATDHDVWYGTLVVLSVYVLLSPWYLYWYLIAPLALVAVLPVNRLTFPVLTFSGTTLITARFPPWLAAQVVQTLLRYLPPLVVFASRVRGDGERRPRLQAHRPHADRLVATSPTPARFLVLF